MPAPTMMTLGPAAAAREPCCATVSAARSTAAASTRALDVEELIFSNQCDMYYQCVYAYLFKYNTRDACVCVCVVSVCVW